MRRSTSRPSTLGSFRSSSTSSGAAGCPACAPGAESQSKGLGPVAGQDDLVLDVVLRERATRQRLVVGVVLHQQDRTVVHDGSSSKREVEGAAPAGGPFGPTLAAVAPPSTSRF